MRKVYIIIFFSFLTFTIFIIFIIFSFQITSHPNFCGSCHYMRPYFESWKTSSHNGIPCVECHIPPGITSEFRKKYEALAMVVRYFTGTYSTNPWAEIEDAACLKCHEKRLLYGKVYFKNILFDHQPHLTMLRRGKKLKCTSCHSQIVQGAHIKVTESTCFICHFKGTELGKKTAKCTMCHGMPRKKIEIASFTFDHSDVEKYSMDCLLCHAHSVEGSGSVPEERCFTCHNEPARISEYKNTEKIHEIHVTIHKVECLNCHQEIYHGKPREIEEVIKTPCSTCHLEGHTPQKDLYMGIGGKGVEPTPSVMFLSGVRCEGCHIIGKEGKIKKSGPFSCMNCHGASYYRIYNSWKENIEKRIKETEKIINEAKSKLKDSEYLENAEYNLKLVKEGGGLHNVLYSEKLLKKAVDFINEGLKEKGISPYKTETFIITEAIIECTRCHYGVERKISTFDGKTFSHYIHILNKIECNNCHNENKEEKPHMITLLKEKKDCVPCHHKENIKKDCITCHGKEINPYHKIHVKEMELKCNECHDKNLLIKEDTCSQCHS